MEEVAAHYYFCLLMVNGHITNYLLRFMGMNKNTIFGWASFCMLLVGIALVLLGVLKYRDHAIGFSTVGIGFFVMSWAFNALKGRV